jgi:hypothetical protein
VGGPRLLQNGVQRKQYVGRDFCGLRMIDSVVITNVEEANSGGHMQCTRCEVSHAQRQY